MITVHNSPFVYDWRVFSIDQQLTTVSPTMLDSIKGSSPSRSNTPIWRTKKVVFCYKHLYGKNANCLHISLVLYKVIDVIRHTWSYIHIFKGNTSLTKSLALSMLFKCFFNSWYVVSSNRIPNKMLAFFRSKFLLKNDKINK